MVATSKPRPGLATAPPVPASWQSISRQLPAIVVADQRKALRRHTDLAGYLVVEGHAPPLPCTVCNLSATGAMIKLQAPPPGALAGRLPDHFALVLTHHKQETWIDCVVVRQRTLEIGVRFHGQFQTVKRQRNLPQPSGR